MGEFEGEGVGFGELGVEDEDGGIECWVGEGVKDALVRRYSIQVRCSLMEEVCC